jgi:hypothetical protein
METPFGPLESLVGRTFCASGLCRYIEFVGARYIAWTRPKYIWPKRRCEYGTILKWLDNAEEVTP